MRGVLVAPRAAAGPGGAAHRQDQVELSEQGQKSQVTKDGSGNYIPNLPKVLLILNVDCPLPACGDQYIQVPTVSSLQVTD